jgi:BirA family biotin operon repressor/biotin-[acetyl-CoA-carboxylase] ligase
MSLVLREADDLLTLRAGLAVSDLAEQAMIKWPNDVLIEGKKVAGILAESRPQENWIVIGIGLNVAVNLSDVPDELRSRIGTLGRELQELPSMRRRLLNNLETRLSQPVPAIIGDLRERDALVNQEISWSEGEGTASGIDNDGNLRVLTSNGQKIALRAGEVHLSTPASP